MLHRKGRDADNNASIELKNNFNKTTIILHRFTYSKCKEIASTYRQMRNNSCTCTVFNNTTHVHIICEYSNLV